MDQKKLEVKKKRIERNHNNIKLKSEDFFVLKIHKGVCSKVFFSCMYLSHLVLLPTNNVTSFLSFISETSYDIQANRYTPFFLFKTSNSIFYIIFLTVHFQFSRWVNTVNVTVRKVFLKQSSTPEAIYKLIMKTANIYYLLTM